MITSDLKDEDGFPLKFEENFTQAEKDFCMKMFPNLDGVNKKKIHCTACGSHVGTAPMAEKSLRTHPVLQVTHCSKCFAFYNSGEFGKGEDGSEYYCRWCGQGGEVFCCSKCPYVFCCKCIQINLSQGCVDDIENNEEWTCFVCAPKVLWPLRAQHWALINYIEKQSAKLAKLNVNDDYQMNMLLNFDATTCCAKRNNEVKKPVTVNASTAQVTAATAKRKAAGVDIAAILKRVAIANAANAAKPKMSPVMKVQKSPVKKKDDQVVCTPDIFSMFNEQNAQKGKAKPVNTTPPPLALTRQLAVANRKTPVQQQQKGTNIQVSMAGNTPSPVFHTIGGFRVDLNHAARQDIFRLPNGKLIQVRKQVANNASTVPQARPNVRPVLYNRNGNPRMPGVSPRMMNQQSVQNQQTRFLISDVQSQFRAQVPALAVQQVIPAPAPQVPPPQLPSVTPGQTGFIQHNGSIIVNRAANPDTPFGKSKTGFEDKIISGMEICQHTINKMITLTNSSSYKNSANFRDMKELYIHLQYLYSYTIGKFKSLQEKLGDDMEGLSKLDPTLDRGEDCDDDDLEIVEKVTDCIEVSDDDEDALPKKTQTAVPSGKPPRKQNLEPKTGTVKFYASKMPDQVVASTSTLEVLAPVILSKDPKLKSHVVVKLERIEGIDQMTIPTDDDNAEMLEEVENSGVNDETISSDETLVDNNCENKDPVVIENMRNETNTEEILLEASSESTEQDKLLVLEQESESLPEATIPENTDINDKPTEVECFNISDDLVEETSETPTEKVPEPLEGIIGIALDNNSVVEEVELSSTDGDQETVIVEENMETETISEVTDNDLQVTQLVESEEILLTETNVVIKASIDAVINSTFESNTESTLPEEIPLSEKLGECPPAEILEELLEDLETIPELNTKTNGHEPMEITEEILAEAEKMECDLVDKASFVEAVPKMDGNVSLDDVSDGNLSD